MPIKLLGMSAPPPWPSCKQLPSLLPVVPAAARSTHHFGTRPFPRPFLPFTPLGSLLSLQHLLVQPVQAVLGTGGDIEASEDLSGQCK